MRHINYSACAPKAPDKHRLLQLVLHPRNKHSPEDSITSQAYRFSLADALDDALAPPIAAIFSLAAAHI